MCAPLRHSWYCGHECAALVRQAAESGRCGWIALVAETAADARDVMVEGPAGLLAIARRGHRPKYEPSKRRVTWANGATATTFSADDPEQLRGPQHDGAWARRNGYYQEQQAEASP
jgi:phage terminase large subunit-like protein